jgi:CHY zinc finger
MCIPFEDCWPFSTVSDPNKNEESCLTQGVRGEGKMSNANDDAYMQQDDDIEMDVAGSDDEEAIDEEGSEGDEEEGDVSEEDIMNDQADDDVEPPPPAEEDVAIARRRAIQAIMRDTSLSEQDKRQSIQDLMSGGRTFVAPPPAPILPAPDANAACVHYERNCNIVSPCCNRVVGCRICHDELSPAGHPAMNRFLIREVVCKNCNTRQPTSYDSNF